MKKIISAIIAIVMILYGSQLFVSNTNAEYYINLKYNNREFIAKNVNFDKII